MTISHQRAQQTWSRRRQQAQLILRPGAGPDYLSALHQMIENAS